MDRYERMLLRLPFVIDWVNYKGKEVVAQINYEATVKAGRPMVDISYCMTKAMNQIILFTCQYDKSKFKPTMATKTKQQYFEDYKENQSEYERLEKQWLDIKQIWLAQSGQIAEYLEYANELIYLDLIKAKNRAERAAKHLLK